MSQKLSGPNIPQTVSKLLTADSDAIAENLGHNLECLIMLKSLSPNSYPV